MSGTRSPGLGRALRARAGALAAAPAWRHPQLRPRIVLAALAGLVLLLAGWLWLRDSSLVAVRTVEVSGIAGSQAPAVRAVLEEAARSMTTLHVRRGALETAVAPFAAVKRLEVSADFPHTLRIHVVTNAAVGVVLVDGRRIPVTSDGTLLRDVAAPAGLPTIPLRTPQAGTRLTDRTALAAIALLADAPEPLRARVQWVRTTAAHGLTAQLAHGPVLWFGDADRLVAKWAAAAAVLADPQAAGASSINLFVPERPAVGGLAVGAPATGESDIPTPPPGSTTTTAAPTLDTTTTDSQAQP